MQLFLENLFKICCKKIHKSLLIGTDLT